MADYIALLCVSLKLERRVISRVTSILELESAATLTTKPASVHVTGVLCLTRESEHYVMDRLYRCLAIESIYMGLLESPVTI